MKVGEIKITKKKMRRAAALTFVPTLIVSCGLLWLHMSFFDVTKLHIEVVPVALSFLLSVPVVVLAHELIHLFMAWSVGVPRDKVRMAIKKGIPHVDISYPATVSQVRIITMSPFVILGTTTAAWLFLTGFPLAALVFTFAVTTCGMDINMWWWLGSFRPDDTTGESEEWGITPILRSRKGSGTDTV